MTVTTDMLLDNTIININSELKLLNNLFENNGWKIEDDNKFSDHIIYFKTGKETEFFKISLDNNNIYVSVPLKNSNFQYKTKFVDYYSAIKYTETKFNYYNNNENNIF